ncbi:hypothetical protein V5O48_012452 [Marasmius crinis-equi]|uniref:Uncharacterized protein n=1 Tax=Marasmius crinis-equi TaxID=585013 RepID=A0ABR3F367_9AGAR
MSTEQVNCSQERTPSPVNSDLQSHSGNNSSPRNSGAPPSPQLPAATFTPAERAAILDNPPVRSLSQCFNLAAIWEGQNPAAPANSPEGTEAGEEPEEQTQTAPPPTEITEETPIPSDGARTPPSRGSSPYRPSTGRPLPRIKFPIPSNDEESSILPSSSASVPSEHEDISINVQGQNDEEIQQIVQAYERRSVSPLHPPTIAIPESLVTEDSTTLANTSPSVQAAEAPEALEKPLIIQQRTGSSWYTQAMADEFYDRLEQQTPSPRVPNVNDMTPGTESLIELERETMELPPGTLRESPIENTDNFRITIRNHDGGLESFVVTSAQLRHMQGGERYEEEPQQEVSAMEQQRQTVETFR